MSEGQRLIPTKINLNKAAEYLAPDEARFIKNLTAYVGATDAYGNVKEGLNSGKLKPLQSNELYIELDLPEGENLCIGLCPDKERNRLIVCAWNDLGNHSIHCVYGSTRTADVVYLNSNLNFQLDPQYFVNPANAWIEVIKLINPATGDLFYRSFFMFTDAFNYLRQIAIEDSIATNGFDETLYPYFKGNYSKESLINIGLPTPKTCIQITEIQRTEADYGLVNNLLFNSWQFRITGIDVWGRPSEHSIISDQYIPGINDCFSSSPNLARCLNLSFDAGSPIMDKYQIEFRNANDQQWYLDSVINLYDGSAIGDWWLRKRNADINFNVSTNTIDYIFCRTREKNAIPQSETNRLYNPVPKKSRALTKIAAKIGVANNEDGFIPFPKDLKDKFTFTITPPEQSIIGSRTITIYIPIYSWKANIFRTVRRDSDNRVVWGGVEGGNPVDYSQYFSAPNQVGFTGYLLGGGQIAVSSQVYVDSAGELVDDPELQAETISDKKITFAKFVYYGVPQGVYVFRLASHLTDITTNSDYELTSTTVWGRCPFDADTFTVGVGQRELSQELIIDVCDKDYNTLEDNKILVIADLAFGSSRAVSGYVYETNVNGYNQNPVELMQVTQQTSNQETQTSRITDHNGYYWYAAEQDGRTFHFNFYYKCNVVNFQQGTGGHEMKFQNIILSAKEIREFGGLPKIEWPDYFTSPCNRILVQGKVLLNGTNIGIPNVVVVLTRGQTAITDDNGEYTIIAHDNLPPPRIDEIILSGSVCNYTNESGGCIRPLPVIIFGCAFCNDADRIFSAPDFILSYATQRGLLSGGTYGIGASVFDWLGRCSYIQDLEFITIPTINQSKTIGASTITATINPTALFGEDIEYITLWVTKELTIEDYITWIVDRAEFIDNSGNINDLAPTQIKIYYASLNEFNKQNNFNTTTNWQFIAPSAEGATQLAYQSDVVQFYINGDGIFFNKLITALVKYDEEGQYFLIDYTADLKDLKPNALVRLLRPKTTANETEPYFELCKIIEIKNRTAQETTFVLNAFDTYYLNRQIPVPAPVVPAPTTTSIATTTTAGGVETTVTQTPVPQATVIELRLFGYAFEHDAPSNFWGKGIFNGGRVNVKNPYENKLIHQNQGALSGVLSITGQLNYLNYFDEAQKTDFNIPNVGGICAWLFEMGTVMILCQYDNYIVGYDDNLARINSDGTVQVASASNQFGKPQRKIGSNYGCQFADKNSIIKANGLVSFVDSNKGEFVQFDYNNISSYTKNQCDGWFKLKVKTVQKSNGLIYFHSCYNPVTGEVLLSNFTLHQNNYINQLRDFDATANETVSFDNITKEFKGSFSYVPEYFGMLDNDILSNQLFSLKQGQPYSHYNVNTNNSYNKFFDVQCEKVLRIVYNQHEGIKLYLSMAVYCPQENYFSDLIITDNNQQSRLLLDAWNKGDYFYFASFQCDLNSIPDINLPDETGKNKLLDGDRLYGDWIDIRIVGEPSKQNNYSELMEVKIIEFSQTST